MVNSFFSHSPGCISFQCQLVLRLTLTALADCAVNFVLTSVVLISLHTFNNENKQKKLF